MTIKECISSCKGAVIYVALCNPFEYDRNPEGAFKEYMDDRWPPYKIEKFPGLPLNVYRWDRDYKKWLEDMHPNIIQDLMAKEVLAFKEYERTERAVSVTRILGKNY